ncbi:MAG: hypothetical protein B7X48_06680 [Acidiphilium sp. 34-60-192]|nr:MAG: hypothetical protein B7X48_06680 [Acidiphilium sp. 34-60-192]
MKGICIIIFRPSSKLCSLCLMISSAARWPQLRTGWTHLIDRVGMSIICKIGFRSCVHRVAPMLPQRIAHIYQAGQARLRLVLDDMAAAGLLVASSDERASLMVNAWIIASYWIDYLTISRTGKAISRADLAEGIHQINQLFAPYLATGRAGAARKPMAKEKAR